MNSAYMYGFERECASRGVDPSALVKKAQDERSLSGDIGKGVDWITKTMPEGVKNWATKNPYAPAEALSALGLGVGALAGLHRNKKTGKRNALRKMILFALGGGALGLAGRLGYEKYPEMKDWYDTRKANKEIAKAMKEIEDERNGRAEVAQSSMN